MDAFEPSWMQDTTGQWWINIGDHDPVCLIEPLAMGKITSPPKQQTRQQTVLQFQSRFSTPRK